MLLKWTWYDSAVNIKKSLQIELGSQYLKNPTYNFFIVIPQNYPVLNS